MTEVTTLELFK